MPNSTTNTFLFIRVKEQKLCNKKQALQKAEVSNLIEVYLSNDNCFINYWCKDETLLFHRKEKSKCKPCFCFMLGCETKRYHLCSRKQNGVNEFLNIFALEVRNSYYIFVTINLNIWQLTLFA